MKYALQSYCQSIAKGITHSKPSSDLITKAHQPSKRQHGLLHKWCQTRPGHRGNHPQIQSQELTSLAKGSMASHVGQGQVTKGTNHLQSEQLLLSEITPKVSTLSCSQGEPMIQDKACRGKYPAKASSNKPCLHG